MKKLKTVLWSVVWMGMTNLVWAAEETSAAVVNIINPSKSVGIQIGDLLNREITIELSKPYQINKNAFPVKGSSKDGIELSDIHVDTTTQDEKTVYKINLTYQVFSYSAKPDVVQLPAEHISIAGKHQSALTAATDIPAWRFWQASLVPTGIKNAKEHIQPQYKSTLIDVNPHKTRLKILFSMLIAGLVGLIYVNADKQWLPFMNGAFAQAHRKIKKLNKDKSGEQKALLYMHQAFNQTHGANLFANDIDDFITAHPAFASQKTAIVQFFERSNAALFSEAPADAKQFIHELTILSKSLRNSVRGVK